ncbi:2-succinyl-5-enolpyruvyl-6-hydroxy-3-cyclohexene-1-carboxylic-acid synthase [Roseivirga sp.]|uniref:2-succinyl-5-enolpyruvyl-6-hydroxy-3- cyclohexene-1-carboxylic-acid synthase n=1 Tax=Roseivirga sp. TaxID=1964215 RepID=UPI003B8ABCBA
MILPHINNIAAICAKHGINTAVISPGSRSAPITLAFNAHPEIDIKVISDERSAAFIALGMAQQQGKPVVLICTSGSAVYNYAPAVAEAFYQEIPLLILSADRPPEWMNQYDGQTIQQNGIFGKHVKHSFQFPVEGAHKDDLWFANRITNEAIISCRSFPKGPVHINIPLREPFYPSAEEKISFDENVRIIDSPSSEPKLSDEAWNDLAGIWASSNKHLVVIGQLEPDLKLQETLQSFAKNHNVVVVNDIIGNQHLIKGSVQHQDAFLQAGHFENLKELRPDLLITIGKSLISKNLKLFLREHPPKNHWHIHQSTQVNDTLQHVTKSINVDPSYFFGELNHLISKPSNSAFNKQWLDKEELAINVSRKFLDTCSFGELKAIDTCLNVLPDQSLLHLANSMTVRYANILGTQKAIEVFANRGTSGIDGSNSTAVGAALAQDKMVTLFTGDMAFFYDRNAFWHNENLSNLRIVVLNNQGGGIFRMINGPRSQADYEKLFHTEQSLNAELTAEEFGFEYLSSDNKTGLDTHLESFFEHAERPKILEVFSDSQQNTEIYEAFKNLFLV